MKSLLPALALAALLGFAGCENTPDLKTAFHNRFTPEFRTHDVGCDARHAYEGVRRALGEIGFRQVGGGPSQGFIEALNQINPDGPNGVARQVSVRVNFSVSPRVPNGTEVAALFKSIEEDRNNLRGGATEVPLIDTPLYDVLFDHLDARLSKMTE